MNKKAIVYGGLTVVTGISTVAMGKQLKHNYKFYKEAIDKEAKLEKRNSKATVTDKSIAKLYKNAVGTRVDVDMLYLGLGAAETIVFATMFKKSLNK